MRHPRDMQHADLAFWIREGLKDCFAIDFLSDRAQNSLINFLAVEVKSFYEGVAKYSGKDYDWAERARWERDNLPVFEKATLRHPLGALFGDTLAKAVNASLSPLFSDLEKGKVV